MTDIDKMTVELSVLKHLGGLYSNIAAVLTEAVANAWDPDAEKVEIHIDTHTKWIKVADDGIGMWVADTNDKYFRPGYRRREESDGRVTPRVRPVMGRKGLSKVSLFSIADTIKVYPATDGEVCGLRMTVLGSTQRTSK